VSSEESPLHVILNMGGDPRTVGVPVTAGRTWRRALDTALASPQDITPLDQQTICVSDAYVVEARSVVVLEAH